MNKIKSAAIYPAIGIARIGNSPEYFLASDIPGVAPDAGGDYKDSNGLIKKQVPLFRIYGFDQDGNPVKEITSDEASITWQVHLANRKAAWYQFNNAMDMGAESLPSTKRNGSVPENLRHQLVIDPGLRSITGNNISGKDYQFDTGKFMEGEVWLGEIRTDELGRLMVFGGSGVSVSHTQAQAITFANNDGWHDDISDGTIRATVKLGKDSFEAKPAMVVCTPPNFAPGLFPVVTMYDVVTDLYTQKNWLRPKEVIDFSQDILPILKRLSSTQWVNEGFFMLFGKNSPSDFSSSEMIETLGNPALQFKEKRMHVFEWFRFTNAKDRHPSKIPPHYGDFFSEFLTLPHVDLSVTATQYEHLERWANGGFITGEVASPVVFEKLSTKEQTECLLRAPLEECLGGPFHPGIEITWPLRNLQLWGEPFRLKILSENEPVRDDYGPILTSEITLSQGGPIDGSGPGTLTRWLGVPWQTDGASCLSGYDTTLYLPLPSFWSARVPNQVLSLDSFQRASKETVPIGQRLKHFSYRLDWLRDFAPTDYVKRINEMVMSWHKLGVLTKTETVGSDSMLPAEWHVETGRIGPKGTDPSLRQVIIAENDLAEKPFMENLPDLPRESRPLKRYEL